MATQTREVQLNIAAHVVWRDVPGALVLFDQRSGEYHTLNEIGAAIWREVSRGEPLHGIVAMLIARYAAAPDVIARDVGDFIAESIGKGLLVETTAASCANAPEVAYR
jgi:Coenzyme PQQ synthesis protein D (PqqD)